VKEIELTLVALGSSSSMLARTRPRAASRLKLCARAASARPAAYAMVRKYTGYNLLCSTTSYCRSSAVAST
jgi:hypothetical protein